MPWRASASARPVMKASAGSFGVDAHFAVSTRPVPSSSSTKSVNVPPVSMPTRQRIARHYTARDAGPDLTAALEDPRRPAEARHATFLTPFRACARLPLDTLTVKDHRIFDAWGVGRGPRPGVRRARSSGRRAAASVILLASFAIAPVGAEAFGGSRGGGTSPRPPP